MDMYLLGSLTLIGLCALVALGLAIDHYRQKHDHPPR